MPVESTGSTRLEVGRPSELSRRIVLWDITASAMRLATAWGCITTGEWPNMDPVPPATPLEKCSRLEDSGPSWLTTSRERPGSTTTHHLPSASREQKLEVNMRTMPEFSLIIGLLRLLLEMSQCTAARDLLRRLQQHQLHLQQHAESGPGTARDTKTTVYLQLLSNIVRECATAAKHQTTPELETLYLNFD